MGAEQKKMKNYSLDDRKKDHAIEQNNKIKNSNNNMNYKYFPIDFIIFYSLFKHTKNKRNEKKTTSL